MDTIDQLLEEIDRELVRLRSLGERGEFERERYEWARSMIVERRGIEAKRQKASDTGQWPS